MPGESDGQRSLAGHSPWGHEESDTTQRLTRLHHTVCRGRPGASDGKESACNVGDLGSIPGLRGGHGNPLQYPPLEKPHGQRSLVGYSPWGRKESDTTERLSTAWRVETPQNAEREPLFLSNPPAVLTPFPWPTPPPSPSHPPHPCPAQCTFLVIPIRVGRRGGDVSTSVSLRPVFF